MALALPPRVGAEEIGGGRLVWLLLTHAIKEQFIPRPVPAVPAAHARMQVEKDATGCQLLRWDRTMSGTPSMGIYHPGRYCLDQDYEVDCAATTPDCTGTMIEIHASNVDLDMRGHALRMSGTRRYRGVWGTGQYIRIHDGRIEGAGIGITLSHSTTDPAKAYPDTQPDAGDVLTLTGFAVERMEFSGVYGAIELSGKDNEVRDNRIDMICDAAPGGRPPVALLSYGPSARIERNTIVLRNQAAGSTGHAMYLRAGHRAVIGENTVNVEGTRSGTIGIGLSDSQSVVLQRNRIDTANVTVLKNTSSLVPADIAR
ncbi:right-handed parallel beta-helix repeat-containing protein [Pseudoduganella albidiflava]|nr:right-handed parallel beta-helix repeat-containing protein [Pseudoduganella albidiflava]